MDNNHVFERYETKYLMNRKQYAQIMQVVRQYMDLDRFGKSLICNIYYDTPDYSLIRRSLDHPLYKEKIRMRSYGTAQPDGRVFIELKKKYDHVVYKRRIITTEAASRVFFHQPAPPQDQIAGELQFTFSKYKDLAPRVFLSYEREAYYMKDGSTDFRVTFDENILYRTTDLSLGIPPYGSPVIDNDQILMELKCAGSLPFWMVRALSEVGVYRTSFSKYGTAFIHIMKEGTNSYAAVI